MSWLTAIVRGLKKRTGLTELEMAFVTVVSGLTPANKRSLQDNLEAVQFAVALGALHSRDGRVETAEAWVRRMLDLLDK